jgi:hypothetical protein
MFGGGQLWQAQRPTFKPVAGLGVRQNGREDLALRRQVKLKGPKVAE